jgi:hypothetical protein
VTWLEWDDDLELCVGRKGRIDRLPGGFRRGFGQDWIPATRRSIAS